MKEPEKYSPPERLASPEATKVHARLSLGEGHGLQFVEFKPGMTGVIESGRVMADAPAKREHEGKPRELGEDRAGEGRQVVTRDAGEQAWFKETFCNGAQNCVQGWDRAIATSWQNVGHGTGIAMVGREGTVNAMFRALYWDPNATWLQFWQGLVLPGHWVSVDVTGANRYIQWRLDGAGANTQVSLAARYGS